MSSIRPGLDARARSDDKTRTRKVVATMAGGRAEGSRQNLSRIPRGEVDNMRFGFSTNTQPRPQPSTRIPQNQPSRKTATQGTVARPPLTHETQSWSPNSGTSGSMRSISATSVTPNSHIDPSKQTRTLLRRKQSSIAQEPNSLRNKARSDSTSSIPKIPASIEAKVASLDRVHTNSPSDVRAAQQIEVPRLATQPNRIYPELDRYRDIQPPPVSDGYDNDMLYRLATDLPPPTPQFSGASSHSQLSNFSASPSTRFSESPGPGPYSRDTTPTSMSSQSPGIVAPMRFAASRAKPLSPAITRPPITRRRAGSTSNEDGSFSADPQGLAVVREALTSSSSNSTVRNDDKKEKMDSRHRGRSPAPPNPPPRKSSHKLTKSPGAGQARSQSDTPKMPTQSTMRSPSPTKIAQPRERIHDTAASPQPRPTPPSRPSRDGTPDLYSQFGGPVPIIQSNLSSTSLSERRQSIQPAPSSLPRSTTPSGHTRTSSSSTRPSLSREPTPAPRPGLVVSAGEAPKKNEAGRTTRTPSPGVSSFKPKFSLFGRRTKTAPDAPQPEKKKDKLSRKGPAAGTGHEGYGRLGAVKRRSSNASNLPRGLPGSVSSSESLASTQSTDPFLLGRMQPVIIAGGEVKENRNASIELARTESNQSVSLGRPDNNSRNNSSASLSNRDDARHTLWPSPFPRASTHSRRPSDTSDSEAVTMKSTLAFRRSIRGTQYQERAPVILPKPINVRAPSAASMATTILTDDSSILDVHIDSSQDRPEPPVAPKKLVKRAKSPRKWNLFGLGQSSSANKKQSEPDVPKADKTAPAKPVAFYTLMDSSEQEDTEQDVGEILREAEVFHDQRPSLRQQRRTSTSMQPTQSSRSRSQSRDARAKATASPAIPRLPLRVEKQQGRAENNPPGPATARPSRLPQVGRIPKVVTTRPQQTSPKSFSRPFNRISLQAPPPQPQFADQGSIAKGPSPPKSNTPDVLPRDALASNDPQLAPGKNQYLGEDPPELGHLENGFFAFPPRKNSECTASSESTCSGVNQTAIVPAPTAPLGEDEVWDEYNDLLGENDSPPSPTSSCGIPFHLETYETKLIQKSAKPLESPTITTQFIRDTRDLRDSIVTGRTAATSSSHFSADMTARLNAAFRFLPDPPATPFSMTEFVSGYGDRNNSNLQVDKLPAPSPRDSSSSRKSQQAHDTKRGSNSSNNSEETPLSQVNLRVGSMTVSKWLTFGHVLFSPVRDELMNVVGSLKRHSILVIDGLGNDDWSFYAAETYPAATFFNLSPRAPLPQDRLSASSFPLSPPNHHQIQYTSHLGKFPFGPESFTAIVFRFPSAAPESHYRNIISEARRVLKPGGYIELSILDVDLNNVGTRTRRAARRLKERVSAQNPDFNLSSTADLVLRLLGKKGFTDIKNCRVGVPVASSLTNEPRKQGKKDERSLAEMMNDETEMGDENIAKMVSKVGRWWYNRLYEVPSGMNKSIWNDRALLAECEQWGTSLKLMVCHARMPERGRVASI
ncbi:hypothetical protein F5Y15DRAFT_413301 [Xylariaceae sp. FL0016]|nr:hypothetical protein F5Y15DRAFT_413301 [Xylariaceae sp. FL0016]